MATRDVRDTLQVYLQDVARAYDSAQHEPCNPLVARCYRALMWELWQQFTVLRAFTRVTFTNVDPYGNSREMHESIDHGSLSVYRTADLPVDHPFSALAPNGETYNSVFRAVHDGFAHYPERLGFGMVGEFRAYLAHTRLLTFDASRALFTETCGQNAWYHCGPRPKTYAPQIATLLPTSLIARASRLGDDYATT